MKVLFWLRSDAEKVPGGDVVYAETLAPVLRRHGISVEISSAKSPDLASFDVIHLFNVINSEETLFQIHRAREAKKPAVLAPEYANLTRFFVHSHWKANALRVVIGESAAGNIFTLKERLRGTMALQKRIFAEATLVVAKSQRERQELRRDFEFDAKRVVVIPNGVTVWPGVAWRFVKTYGVRDFILCIGRIEPIKNQLSLIRGTKGLDYPIVCIGAAVASQSEYERRSRNEAAGRDVRFISWLQRKELFDAYAAAAVHVAPSFSETFSYTTAEALLSGTQAVITTESPYREYFGGHVFPCDPYDVSSIRRAVVEAIRFPKNLSTVRRYLARELQWQKVARRLADEYKRLAYSGKRQAS